MAETRKRKFWGWGYEAGGPNLFEQQKHMAERMAKRFGLGPARVDVATEESELNLRAPRNQPSARARGTLSMPDARARGHTYGKSSGDIRRAFLTHHPESDRRGRVSARRARSDSPARMVRRCAPGGNSLRRRIKRVLG